MEWERLLSIPVFAVLLQMGFVYYVTVFSFLDDWLGLRTSVGSLNAIIFTSLICYCLFSFFVCVLTDPGRVPPSYVPDVEDSDVSDQETKQPVMLPRKCDTCSNYKPPRCHHCRVCKRCVLRMDHHCVWTNNCVGYWNYKAFFILVLSATLGSIYAMVIVVSSAFRRDWESTGHAFPKVFYVICGTLMMSLSLILGSLLVRHIYLLSHNMTTIESYEATRAAWLARKSGQSYRNPFDLGFYKNVTLVLGPNMMKWLWPTAVGHLKDGISFRVTRDTL
ncbi:probable protein S-acyltransferase 15 [Punica granatum]|uniref:S-acyltransferase n=1 Tax=Punica granatum TaxID=22663 RepID=A0A6P8C3I7_PUNGR|nr:probable protein S-acyltransferase 15 [Punica granatum]